LFSIKSAAREMKVSFPTASAAVARVLEAGICGNPAGNEEIAFFFTQNIWMYSTRISDTMGSAGFGTPCPGATSGSNTLLKVNLDGTGGTYSPTTIATIEGLTALSLSTLITDHHLIIPRLATHPAAYIDAVGIFLALGIETAEHEIRM
jgi:hypothetical protein